MSIGNSRAIILKTNKQTKQKREKSGHTSRLAISISFKTTEMSAKGELSRAGRASEAPLVRKIGNLSCRENLVITSPYERPSFLQTLREGWGVSMSPAISGVLN